MLRLSGCIVLLWLLGVCLAPPARAETLTLRQALTFGLQDNFDLRVAQLAVDRGEAAILGEQGRFDTSVELALSHSRNDLPAASLLIDSDQFSSRQTRAEAALSQPFTTGLQARLSLSGERSDTDTLADRLDPAYRTSLVLDLTQPLLKDAGRQVNTAGTAIARDRHQQAAYGYLASALQLAGEIELAYFDLAEAETEHDHLLLAHELASQLLTSNRRKLAAGLIPIAEVSEAEAAVVSREETLLLIRQKIVRLRHRLAELIDQEQGRLATDWQVALPELPAGPDPALDEAVTTGLERRPELQQARLETTVSRRTLTLADNRQLPRLDLQARFGLHGLSGDDDSGASTHAGPGRDALRDDGSSWFAGLRYSMPLQNRVARADLLDAKAEERQVRHRLQRAELAATTSIQIAHANLQLGRQRLATAVRSSALAQTTLDQENRRLAEGLSDTFRVLLFQRALVEANLRELAARADLLRAQAGLRQAMATTLDYYHIDAALPREALP
ncbi:MAG: TolC family protein [Desulfuromonadales bacterium]|nr:TolC family protein [Desulfuromonadales bacterium]